MVAYAPFLDNDAHLALRSLHTPIRRTGHRILSVGPPASPCGQPRSADLGAGCSRIASRAGRSAPCHNRKTGRYRVRVDRRRSPGRDPATGTSPDRLRIERRLCCCDSAPDLFFTRPIPRRHRSICTLEHGFDSLRLAGVAEPPASLRPSGTGQRPSARLQKRNSFHWPPRIRSSR